MAAEGEAGSSGSQSLDLGDLCGYGCPKSPEWDDGVESTESEGTSSSEQCERNSESLALNVVGQDQSGGKISLFLDDWELAKVASSCHVVLDLSCQELGCCCQRGLLPKQGKPFSHRGWAVTKRRGMW